jgi:DNA-binding response OmpR family regulator
MSQAQPREPKILLVDDDHETRGLIARAISEAGWSVTAVGQVSAAIESLRGGGFSLIVLDLGLPDGSGITLCRDWRNSGVKIPILILTARSEIASRVEGLDAGADDYLSKPFAVAELKARMRALLRRGGISADERVIEAGELTVDFGRRRAWRSGTEIALTRREFELLERLVRARGHAVSRNDLLDEIWGGTTPEAGASLEVIVGRLRRKLDAPGSERLIRTLRGHGYAFVFPGTGATPEAPPDPGGSGKGRSKA